MKTSSGCFVGLALAAMPAGPAFAQDTDPVYVGGAGGFSVTSSDTSGQVVGEAGYRVAQNVFVYGNVGQFHNLSSSQLQPAVDDETATLLNSGLTVTGTATMPAWYTTGGVRVQIPMHRRITPYVFGGAGLAHMMPTAHFTYQSGTLLGATPSPGDDVTSQIVSLGDFAQPAASNALMVSGGGGVEAAIAPHISLDVGYKLSHIAGDTPINAQSVVFGFGYHF
ncbi:MAG TPA: outer membrane beta-barrel protein [Vicinamibacterales bacterium]